MKQQIKQPFLKIKKVSIMKTSYGVIRNIFANTATFRKRLNQYVYFVRVDFLFNFFLIMTISNSSSRIIAHVPRSFYLKLNIFGDMKL